MRRKDREVTDIAEIGKVLDSCKVCHVAMNDGETPYIVPLNYGYELEGQTLTLYFHSAQEGRKIDLLRRDNHVCFEISREGEPVFPETPCRSGYYFSSVIGRGQVFFIADTPEKTMALSKMFAHQSGRDVCFTAEQAEHVCVYKIVSREYSCKQKPMPRR